MLHACVCVCQHIFMICIPFIVCVNSERIDANRIDHIDYKSTIIFFHHRKATQDIWFGCVCYFCQCAHGHAWFLQWTESIKIDCERLQNRNQKPRHTSERRKNTTIGYDPKNQNCEYSRSYLCYRNEIRTKMFTFDIFFSWRDEYKNVRTNAHPDIKRFMGFMRQCWIWYLLDIDKMWYSFSN